MQQIKDGAIWTSSNHFQCQEWGLPFSVSRMGFAVHVRSAGQKYGPTCHQRDRADVTEFVTLVRLSSLGQHVGVLALAGYKRRKSALTANPIDANDAYTHNNTGLYTKHAAASRPSVLMVWQVPSFGPTTIYSTNLCHAGKNQ